MVTHRRCQDLQRPGILNFGKLVAEALEEIKQYEWCEMIRVMITTTDTAAIKIAEVFGFERYGTEKKSLKINGNYFDDHYYNKYFDR
ncbi:hypothetical protein HOF92_15515 [bacterium]|nr:hypothetical protein [bacterium]